MSTRSPVLFLIFNRPETTSRVFDAIRAARPPRLYVAADGPRPGRVGEAERCESARRIATAVDWPCQLITLMRDENLGCKLAPSSAITWFFEQESEGIVLEDDCLPDPSFFAYCDDLLARYRDEPQVMCISGYNFVSSVWQPEASYYFSNYGGIWGWATWRRAWAGFDVEMSAWRSGHDRTLDEIFPDQPRARAHWKRLFDSVTHGKVDAWDYQWLHARWRRHGLSCVPRTNLVSNIGFGPGATHTVSAEHRLAHVPRGSLALPLDHPATMLPSLEADRWVNRHIFGVDEHASLVATWARALVARLQHLLAPASH